MTFPPFGAGNVIRGLLGKSLWGSPGFAQLCAPKLAAGPSGIADPPRPFVLRASPLDGRVLEAGERFSFDVHIFDLRPPAMEALERGFSGMTAVWNGVEWLANNGETAIHEIPLNDSRPVSAITVTFLTPVDLKGNTSPSEIPFGVLFARVRDRIATLSELYGDGPVDLDFRAAGARANLVRTVKCEIQYRDVSRRSGTTGRVHPIGGFTGTAHYEGDLGEFVPWLRATFWAGVGRHSVWGNGMIRCE